MRKWGFRDLNTARFWLAASLEIMSWLSVEGKVMEDWQRGWERKREMYLLLWEHRKKASFSKSLPVSHEGPGCYHGVRANTGTSTIVMGIPLGSFALRSYGPILHATCAALSGTQHSLHYGRGPQHPGAAGFRSWPLTERILSLLEPPIQGCSPVLFDAADEDATVVGDILLICPTDDVEAQPWRSLWVRLISSSVIK